jgi:hypothetical protein
MMLTVGPDAALGLAGYSAEPDPCFCYHSCHQGIGSAALPASLTIRSASKSA